MLTLFSRSLHYSLSHRFSGIYFHHLVYLPVVYFRHAILGHWTFFGFILSSVYHEILRCTSWLIEVHLCKADLQFKSLLISSSFSFVSVLCKTYTDFNHKYLDPLCIKITCRIAMLVLPTKHLALGQLVPTKL